MKPTIIPIPGEQFRVLVRSRSRPNVLHLVDVEEKWCGCEDWEFKGPAKRGEKECWHLGKARRWIVRRMLKKSA